MLLVKGNPVSGKRKKKSVGLEIVFFLLLFEVDKNFWVFIFFFIPLTLQARYQGL